MTRTTAAATASAMRGNSQRVARANPRRIASIGGAATGAKSRANSRSSQSDMRTSFPMRQPSPQRRVGAIEARSNRPYRATQHGGDLLVGQSLGVAQHHHDPLFGGQFFYGALNPSAHFGVQQGMQGVAGSAQHGHDFIGPLGGGLAPAQLD